jgi:hypothetical protein
MWRLAKLTIAALLLGCLSSCSRFDFGIEWRGGPYALVWIDSDSDTSLSRDLGGGSWIGRVDATVFAVGRNDKFVVAKQHPAGDRNRTDYFIVDALRDSDMADPSDVVLGPLSKEEYDRKAVELTLPEFSKVLRSLE